MSDEQDIEQQQTTETENISELQTINYKLKTWKYIIIHT
jgi:hypothetical protein